VARLLAIGADRVGRDNEGRTPLHLAATSRHEAVTRLLAVELGANVEATALGIQAVGGRVVSGKVNMVGKRVHVLGGSAEGGLVVGGGIAHGGIADGASAHVNFTVGLEYIMHSGFGDGGSLNVDSVQAVGGAAEGGVVTVKILDSALTFVHLAINRTPAPKHAPH